MWKIIAENWWIIPSTASILVSVIALVFNFKEYLRLKRFARSDGELKEVCEKQHILCQKVVSISEIMAIIPGLIKEAEEVFTAPKSGVLKFGYVIQQIQKRLDDAHIDVKAASEFSDYIESILATPEKKGDLDVSKAHETSQR